MSYLNLLPANVHEDIAKRIYVDDPYSVEVNIDNQRGNIKLIFYKYHKISKDIISSMHEVDSDLKIIEDDQGKIKHEYTYLISSPIELKNNIFTVDCVNYKYRFYFKGDNIFYADNKIFRLTWEANKTLLTLFNENIFCSICQQKIFIIGAKNNLNTLNIFQKCSTCNLMIKNVHPNCVKICPVCDKFIHNYCLGDCEKCGFISCRECSCSKSCSKCYNIICSGSENYTQDHQRIYCFNCMKTCKICHISHYKKEEINKCYKCKEYICNIGTCKKNEHTFKCDFCENFYCNIDKCKDNIMKIRFLGTFCQGCIKIFYNTIFVILILSLIYYYLK